MSDNKNKLRYEDLQENCKILNKLLKSSQNDVAAAKQELILRDIYYLKQINILQDQIIALQLELMTGSDA